MCLTALAWRLHPRYALALIANRDERPVLPPE
ncbi:MAG TPA: NRDE family protein [Luteimonas sp.]|nr:NRDE family protein [Luteimonas sp.]